MIRRRFFAWVLVGALPEHVLVAAHQHEMRDHVVGRAHGAGPAAVVVADRVQAQRTKDLDVVSLEPGRECNGRLEAAEHVGNAAALAVFYEHSRQ